MAIENIIFDVGGTLLRFDLGNIASDFAENPADAELLRDAFQVDWRRLDEGTVEYADFRIAALKRLPERLHGTAGRMLDEWFLHEPPVPGMAEFLAEMKTRYRCYILSNAPIFFAEHIGVIPESDGMAGKVVSGYEKLLKPDPAIYRLFLSRFGLRAEDCFFIDDNPANVETAERLGFRCCLFDGDPDTARRELKKAERSVCR